VPKSRRRSRIDAILDYFDRLEQLEFLLFKTVLFAVGTAFILKLGYGELRPIFDAILAWLRSP